MQQHAGVVPQPSLTPAATPGAHVPQVLPAGHGQDATLIYSQNPQAANQQTHVLAPDVSTTNPAAAPIEQGQPVLKFFGGYPTSPSADTAGAQITQPTPPGHAPATTTLIDPQCNIASKISYHSLKSGPRDRM